MKSWTALTTYLPTYLPTFLLAISTKKNIFAPWKIQKCGLHLTQYFESFFIFHFYHSDIKSTLFSTQPLSNLIPFFKCLFKLPPKRLKPLFVHIYLAPENCEIIRKSAIYKNCFYFKQYCFIVYFCLIFYKNFVIFFSKQTLEEYDFDKIAQLFNKTFV